MRHLSTVLETLNGKIVSVPEDLILALLKESGLATMITDQMHTEISEVGLRAKMFGSMLVNNYDSKKIKKKFSLVDYRRALLEEAQLINTVIQFRNENAKPIVISDPNGLGDEKGFDWKSTKRD